MVSADPVPTNATTAAQLTGPGAEFEIVERLVRGIPTRVYAGGPQTLRDVLLASAAFGDQDYLVYGTERWTYAEHLRQVTGLARRLVTYYGLRKGDRIAVTMRNYPEWSAICYAAWTAGLVVVPLNAWWTAAELHYALIDAGALFVVADAERTRLIAPQLATLGRIPLVEVRGADSPAPGVLRWADLVAALDNDAVLPDVDVTPDDDATILYTSGTTGRPKGAIGTHRNHCTNIRNMALAAAAGAASGGEPPAPDAPQQAALCTFPLFHIAGMSVLCSAVLNGAKLVTQYKWDSGDALELVARERLTGVYGVPTVMRELVEAADPARLTTLTSIGMGGAPIPPDLIGRIDTVFASAVAPGNGYGLTETTSTVVANRGADYVAHPDSVGRCMPGTDLRVVDPAGGADLPDGEVGELWVRGANVVRGYWNNPEATAKAFTDGWFHTGDLGTVRDGFVYVVDRMKDVVIRGGENIYCAEVEAALFEHPAVADVAVVGIPDDRLGEEAVAIVHLRPGLTVATEDLRRHVRERLASFKVPTHVVFRDQPLPRTPSGKVLKRELRGPAAAQVGAFPQPSRPGAGHVGPSTATGPPAAASGIIAQADRAGGAAAGIDADRVGRWLADHVDGLVGPVTFARIPGGHSNLTYRVTDARDRVCVVRRPPVGGVLSTAHDMAREWRFISAFAATDVPVAAPLAFCDDPDVTGATFSVLGFVDGLVLADPAAAAKLPPAARATAAENLVDVLVALHAVDPHAAGLGDLMRATGYAQRQLRRWHHQAHQYDIDDLTLLDEVHDLLAAHVPAQRNGIVHGDYRPGNLAFGPDGSVRAVFDWELATSGDPLADLGYLVSNWQEPGDPSTPEAPGPTTVPGFPCRAEIVERYARLSGRDVSDVPYWVAFSRWRSACINVGVRARYLAGHMVDDDGYQRYVRTSAEQGRQLGETARNALRELGV